MTKTGEGYAAARRHVASAKPSRTPSRPATESAAARGPRDEGVRIAGWHLSGTAPRDYECTLEPAGPDAQRSAVLRARGIDPGGFGTLMQEFIPEEYRGRRVRFSALVKTADVVGWSGLWMRVDDAAKRVLQFDNMQSRPVRGTTGWTRYAVVLDVPAATERVAFGVLLDGGGAVWLADVTLEAVGDDVPSTNALPVDPPRRPQNLDFEAP